jgi:phosphatidylserine/phosphatidylglycerophosphate/cardiolipin synthase-like enzyme
MGSWNMAVDDLNGFWNNAMAVVSKSMADRYAQTFEMLWTKFDPVNPQKTGNVVNHDITLGAINAQVFFPSEDHTTDAIVKAVQTATTSIHFLAFSFTSQPIGDAIVAKASSGVEVGGVFESRGACSSQYKGMAARGLRVVRWEHDYHHYMHEKVIVIDGKTVIFGSFNFSDNADHGNDENVIIVTDPTLAAMFESEYRLVDQAARLKAAQAPCPQ